MTDLSDLDAQMGADELVSDVTNDPRSGYSGSLDGETFEWSGEGTPPLYVIDQHRRDSGVVGEEVSFMVTYLTVAVGGGLVIMSGPSSTGKDAILNGVKDGLPEGFGLQLPNRSTEASFYRDADRLNAANVHFHGDLTAMPDWREDVLKNVSEGDTAEKSLSVMDDEGEYQTERFIVRPPDAIATSIATDNKRMAVDDFPELRNRAIVVPTDATREQTRRIQKREAQNWAGRYVYEVNESTIQRLRDHVNSIPLGQYDIDNDENPDFIHPYAPVVGEDHPIAELFPEARRDQHRFWKFVNVICLWHHRDRIQTDVTIRGETRSRFLVTPQDMWYAMRVYGERLLMSSLNLGDIDKRILWLLKEGGGRLTVSEIASRIQRVGITAAAPEIRQSCKKMDNKNYLTKHDDGPKVEYSAAQFAANVEEFPTLPWSEIIATADDGIDWLVSERDLDTDIADRYVATFLEKPVECVHPRTGHVVDIEEYTAFEERLEQKREELKAMVESHSFGDETDPGDAGLPEEEAEVLTADGGDEDEQVGVGQFFNE